MNREVFRVLRPGLSASIQDGGRGGLARFGVPPGGVMDDHAAACANHLVGNPADAPVIESLLQGLEIEVTAGVTVAITGADATCNHPRWKRIRLGAGDRIAMPASRDGLWSYIAIDGGIDAPIFFRSASVSPRAGIGRVLVAGDVLSRRSTVDTPATHEAADRRPRAYDNIPPLRVWRGPQWESFDEATHHLLFGSEWLVTSQSDRSGYRLAGARLGAAAPIPSEPVLVGSIQVPPSGQPIVTMRDGPTVGGYPKIGLVDPGHLSWLAQCRPGTSIRFEPVDA